MSTPRPYVASYIERAPPVSTDRQADVGMGLDVQEDLNVPAGVGKREGSQRSVVAVWCAQVSGGTAFNDRRDPADRPTKTVTSVAIAAAAVASR